jgi:2C-methyl-D-erythritol 2,4-cyclodiphosphate synthase
MDRVSLKATTGEKLGFIGRKEGACALAVVLLQKE